MSIEKNILTSEQSGVFLDPKRRDNMNEDNILIDEVEFNQELYDKNMQENEFDIEYEGGEDNANNEG